VIVASKEHFLALAAGKGWLRSVGSLKLQVSFATEPYEKDYIQCVAVIVASREHFPALAPGTGWLR